MTLFRKRSSLVWALILGGLAPGLATTAAAAAGTPGVVIVRTDRTTGPRAGTRTTHINLTHNAARIDGEGTAVIYRKDLDTAWVIQGNSYMVLNEAAARAVKQQITSHSGAVQTQLGQALAALPPEKRALVEQMMSDQKNAGAAPGMAGAAPKPRQPTFTKGARDKVGPWGCDVYDGHLDGELAQRVCATGIEDLGLNDADVEIMLYAAEFFWKLSSNLGGQAAAPPPDLLGIEEEQGFPGYALRRQRYENGALTHESTVTKAERTELDSALFEKPALEERKLGPPAPKAPAGAPK